MIDVANVSPTDKRVHNLLCANFLTSHTLPIAVESLIAKIARASLLLDKNEVTNTRAVLVSLLIAKFVAEPKCFQYLSRLLVIGQQCRLHLRSI